MPSLDEPFGALDALTRTDMTQVWLSAMRARHAWTVVLAAHDVREAVFLADRVAVLGPRPTSVIRELHVQLLRPRDLSVLTEAEFAVAEGRGCSPRRSGRERGRVAPPRAPAEAVHPYARIAPRAILTRRRP